MASLGIVLLAGISYIVIITLISGNASEYSENEILRRLEVIEQLNSDLKIENARLRLKTTGLRKHIDAARRQNIELEEKVNEVNEWMHFQEDNNSNIEIQSGRWSVLRMPDHQANESQKENSISSVQRRSKFLIHIIFCRLGSINSIKEVLKIKAEVLFIYIRPTNKMFFYSLKLT